ncbi:hypothetical protein ACFYM7_34725 [Streptomyces cyaneofuscatus]
MSTTIMTRVGLLRSAALTICGRREGKLESCNLPPQGQRGYAFRRGRT